MRQDYVRVTQISIPEAKRIRKRAYVKGSATVAFGTSLVMGVFVPIFWISSFIIFAFLMKVDKKGV